MSQLFSPAANTAARASLLGAVALPAVIILAGSALTRSPYNTKVNIGIDQPVPFSHEHHSVELGIDCRYCHSSVETSPFAGIPPTHTCMSCHSQIWTNSPLLEPLRNSYRTGEPLRWNRVNKLPEFVYFNHSIHVNRGINCNVCHGPVQKTQLTAKGKPFFMAWCLQCHRNPEGYLGEPGSALRPYMQEQLGEVDPDTHAVLHNQDYKPSADRIETGKNLVKRYGIKKEQLTDCWVCHR